MKHRVFISHCGLDNYEKAAEYLQRALELEMEKSFGSSCSQVLRLREKRTAIQ